MRATEAREPMWLVGVIGLAMLGIGASADVLAMAAGWSLALLLGAVLVLAAWRMRASRDARSLRLVLAGSGAASLLGGASVGVVARL